MNPKKFAALLALIAGVFPAASFADDQVVSCDSTCSDGQVIVSFTDGNNSTCICQNPAAMQPTTPDPNVQEVFVDQPS